MAVIERFLKPDGDDGADGTSWGTAWKTLKGIESGGKLDPHADTVLHLGAGDYAGGVFYGDEQWVLGRGGLTIVGESGARITSPGRKGHGLLIENWGGLVRVENLYVEPNGNGQEDGIRITAAGRAEVVGVKVKGAGQINVHLSEVMEGLVDQLDSREAKAQHGLYLANGTCNILVTGAKLWGNAGCGVQINTDVRIRNPLHPARRRAKGIRIQRSHFLLNGRLGGADVNCDGTEDLRVLSNYFAGRNGRGSVLSHFHSDYNEDAQGPLLSTGTLFAGNTVRGGGCYAVFALTDFGIAVAENDIDVTPANGQTLTPKLIEADLGWYSEGFTWGPNKWNGQVTVRESPVDPASVGVTPSTTAGLAVLGLTVDFAGNPRNEPPTLGAFEPGTQWPANDYAPPVPPPPPPPPATTTAAPVVLPPLPATAPAGVPLDPALVDWENAEALYLMEWNYQDRAGLDFTAARLMSLGSYDPVFSPGAGYGRYGTPNSKTPAGMGSRFAGAFVPPVSGVIQFMVQGKGKWAFAAAGVASAEGDVGFGGHESDEVYGPQTCVTVEAGKPYPLFAATMIYGDYMFAYVWVRWGEMEEFIRLPVSWQYPLLNRPPVGGGTTPAPTTTLPPLGTTTQPPPPTTTQPPQGTTTLPPASTTQAPDPRPDDGDDADGVWVWFSRYDVKAMALK